MIVWPMAVGMICLVFSDNRQCLATDAKLEAYLSACVEVEQFNGSVLVRKDEQTLLAKGYGWANAEHQVANTPQTKFRLGSITKQFTAVAVLLLQEDGKLNVDDRVSKYLDDAPEAWEEVTIHHLLSHTSGIPSFTSLPDYLRTSVMPATPQQIIKRFRDKPLEFKPGEKFAYSNSGYILLGAIIEKASGKTYEGFLKERVFVPLALRDTGYDHHATILAHRATGYERESDGLVNSAYIDMSVPYAAGALYSTVEDLGRWDEALTGGKLLSAESLVAMYEPVKSNYGYGWSVKVGPNRKEYAHGGGVNGFNTYILRRPEEKLCVVVLANVAPTNAGKMANELAAIVAGETYTLPRKREIAKIDPQLYDTYAGRYELKPDLMLTVERSSDRILVQATGQPQIEVFPESESKFFYKIVDAQITFVKDDEGNVTHLILHQGGMKLQAKRLK